MRYATLPVICLAALCAPVATAGAKAVVKEYDRVFTTYPYSDPDPVPTMSRFYPYFRYDGFTDKPIQKKWKVVELSNDYLQILILPEIGGKVWAAIDKTTGKPFIYFNHVVKFRDVSMRGPWTSGGMEANYGIIGHTPNCFSPVDYLVRRNPDGSASCIIGTLDLLTRTTWRLEINLPAGPGLFLHPLLLAQRLRARPALLHLDERRHQVRRQPPVHPSRHPLHRPRRQRPRLAH